MAAALPGRRHESEPGDCHGVRSLRSRTSAFEAFSLTGPKTNETGRIQAEARFLLESLREPAYRALIEESSFEIFLAAQTEAIERHFAEAHGDKGASLDWRNDTLHHSRNCYERARAQFEAKMEGAPKTRERYARKLSENRLSEHQVAAYGMLLDNGAVRALFAWDALNRALHALPDAATALGAAGAPLEPHNSARPGSEAEARVLALLLTRGSTPLLLRPSRREKESPSFRGGRTSRVQPRCAGASPDGGH
jgi:hypothetical protein